jgi:hypothetical protein
MKNICILYYKASFILIAFIISVQALNAPRTRIVYINVGSTWAQALSDSWLRETSRNGYNYVLAEFYQSPKAWNGLGNTTRFFIDSLAKCFVKINSYKVNGKGMRLIPMFKFGSNAKTWACTWATTTKATSAAYFNIDSQNDTICPTFAPDRGGIDSSLNSCLRGIRAAFDSVKSTGKAKILDYDSLEYIHLGYDEIFMPEPKTSGAVPVYLAIGQCSNDSAYLVSLLNKGMTLQNAITSMLASDIKRKVSAVTTNLYGFTKTMVYADMLGSFLNGGEPFEYIGNIKTLHGSTVTTGGAIDSLSGISGNIVLMPWAYATTPTWNLNYLIYNTYGVLNEFTTKGYKMIPSMGIDFTLNLPFSTAQAQMGQWITYMNLSKFNSSILGFANWPTNNWSIEYTAEWNYLCQDLSQ